MNSDSRSVAVLTVTYGNRWNFLRQVIDMVMKDKHVIQLVIVDNGSSNQHEIQEGVQEYGARVHIIRNEKNIGSAGGFAKGVEYMRSVECEYVLMLDDDNLPEEGAIGKYLEQIKNFQHRKVVLVGNRVNIPGNEDVFYSNEEPQTVPKGTFFEALSLKKLLHFFALFIGRELHKKRPRLAPQAHVANESFVYGGAFIPIDAIRQAPLPDKGLVLYGDDIEYSWGIKRLGYESYVCHSPKIYDLDMSFGEASQAVGVMAPDTRDFRTYYRIRNMILISRRNTPQLKLALFLNVGIWITGLLTLGAIRYGFTKSYFRKAALIFSASWAGYFPHTRVPVRAQLPH
jgi:GT2 family glycosyltransferase